MHHSIVDFTTKKGKKKELGIVKGEFDILKLVKEYDIKNKNSKLTKILNK